MSPPSHPPPHRAPLGCQSTGFSSLRHTANFHLLSFLHMVVYMFPCCSLNLSHSLLPLPQVCSLCLFLHCCPADMFNSNIFLDSISSVQFICSVVSNSLRPHELQHARPPYPSPAPGVYSNSCPSSRCCQPAISSSVIPSSSCPNPSQHQGLFQ